MFLYTCNTHTYPVPTDSFQLIDYFIISTATAPTMVICSVSPLKKCGKTRRMCEDVHETMLKFLVHTETWERLSWTLRLWDSLLQSEFTTRHTWRTIHCPNSTFEEEIHGSLEVNLTLQPTASSTRQKWEGQTPVLFCQELCSLSVCPISAKTSQSYQALARYSASADLWQNGDDCASLSFHIEGLLILAG